MTKRILALTLFPLALPGITAFAQQEGSTPTQALVAFDSKTPVSPTAKDLTAKVDNRATNLLNLAPVPPNGAQVALLINDGLRTSIPSQASPSVASAVTDAQRAGVAVYSIYYSDAGFRGGRGSFSGQSYLLQVAQGTGGQAYYQGTGNPVSLVPFLKQFQNALAET